MTRRSIAVTAAALLAAVALVAVLLGPHAGAPDVNAVSGGGFTLVSTEMVLPADDAAFPPRAGSDLLTANCTGCHSASMILGQPPLKPEQWQAEVKKMREVYKAPVAERDVPALLDALAALGAQRSAKTPPG